MRKSRMRDRIAGLEAENLALTNHGRSLERYVDLGDNAVKAIREILRESAEAGEQKAETRKRLKESFDELSKLKKAIDQSHEEIRKTLGTIRQLAVV